ncbi:MAG: ribose-phosphate diphosphokinase [Anaerolineae bacterium]|nr:ribose-phosphate diphosphokinase [Anaerolineae bacterium]
MTDHKRHFGEIRLIAGNANTHLAIKIAKELGLALENSKVGRFPDGEVKVDLDCVVRGTDVFIIQPICQSHHSPLKRPCLAAGAGAPPGLEKEVCTYQSINDNLVELLVMIDAARRASAGRITAVVPYMAYAKQEKKKKGHEPITAKLVANLITTAGADRLLTVDLHTPAIEGFFDIPVDHMRMALLMGAHFRDRLGLEDAVVVSPDAGGVARATEFRNHLKANLPHDIVGDEMAIAFKRRTLEDQPTIIEMVGKVAGRPAVIFDDIIQSGGTLLEVVRLLKERGATGVHAAVVHADLTPGAAEAVTQSPLESLVLSDTTASAGEVMGGKIRILSTARILAHAIWRIHTQQSIGWIFDTLGDEGKLPKFKKE